MQDQRFSSSQVVVLTGITPRQLQWWDERGIVVPAREGHRRLYTLDDIAEVAVICDLRKRGFSLQRVRKVVRFLQRELGRRLVETVTAGSDYHLLTDGKNIFLENTQKQVIDVLKNSRQPMLTICLSDTVREIRAELRERKVSPAQPNRVREGQPTTANATARKPAKGAAAERKTRAASRVHG